MDIQLVDAVLLIVIGAVYVVAMIVYDRIKFKKKTQ